MAKKKSADPAPARAPRTRAAASTPKSTTRKKSAAKAEADTAADRADAAGVTGSATITIEQTVTRITYSPSYEEIAEAAYHRYLNRGGDHGADFDDWVEAERELRERQG